MTESDTLKAPPSLDGGELRKRVRALRRDGVIYFTWILVVIAANAVVSFVFKEDVWAAVWAVLFFGCSTFVVSAMARERGRGAVILACESDEVRAFYAARLEISASEVRRMLGFRLVMGAMFLLLAVMNYVVGPARWVATAAPNAAIGLYFVAVALHGRFARLPRLERERAEVGGPLVSSPPSPLLTGPTRALLQDLGAPAAIVHWREVTGASLADAKAFVDSLAKPAA